MTKIKKYKFWFKDGKTGTLRTNVNWNKKTVNEYNKLLGYKHIIKTKVIPKRK